MNYNAIRSPLIKTIPEYQAAHTNYLDFNESALKKKAILIDNYGLILAVIGKFWNKMRQCNMKKRLIKTVAKISLNKTFMHIRLLEGKCAKITMKQQNIRPLKFLFHCCNAVKKHNKSSLLLLFFALITVIIYCSVYYQDFPWLQT